MAAERQARELLPKAFGLQSSDPSRSLRTGLCGQIATMNTTVATPGPVQARGGYRVELSPTGGLAAARWLRTRALDIAGMPGCYADPMWSDVNGDDFGLLENF